MRRGLTLKQLAAKIEAQRGLKADYVFPASSLEMKIQDDKMPIIALPDTGDFPILPVAHDHLSEKLEIPRRYYDRCLTNSPTLLADNVNHWFRRSDKVQMLRTLGGDLRAYLSDRYQRIEHEEIAEAALPALLNTPGLKVVAAEVTDRRLYLLATTDRVKADVKVGDVVQVGVAISNSEVGCGRVSIQPMVYRLRCLNGMILPDGAFRAHHLGRRVQEGEDLNAIFTDETRRADDRALLLKVRDTVRWALSEAAFAAAVDRMRGLSGMKISGDPNAAVGLIAKKVGATDSERGGILRSLIEGGDLSAWGLLNAVTHQAHAAASFDRAVEFEQAGGSLLTLPASEWKPMLEAAQ
jgi:hypothetical protein